MQQGISERYRIRIGMLALASLVVFLMFESQGNLGFSLWDEGFLWYGAQRVMLGEIPLLDFMAYDPGRYYWSAIVMSALGDAGIMSLRASVALFQVLGLFVALMLIAQSAQRYDRAYYGFCAFSALALVVWMVPRHKLFDISLCIFLIGALTYLVQRPVMRRYFLAGVAVGFIAVFGRNHGVYGAIGSLGVMLWLSINRTTGPAFPQACATWIAGVAVGFSPIVLLMLAVPGFASAFRDSVLFLFEHGATNLPLPVPWIWTVNFSGLTLSEAVRSILVGLYFMGLPLFAAVSVVWAVVRRSRDEAVPPALVAAAFLAIPYAHAAFSRAGMAHLAQGIFPLLIGCLAILSTKQARIKWPLAIALFVSSLWVIHVLHPAWQCHRGRCQTVEISGSNLEVGRRAANDIGLLRRLAEEFGSEGQSFVAAPFWPGAYALLERRAPMWEIYGLFPRAAGFERREIERIKEAAPAFIVIFDFALDGRDDLRFKNTHPLTYQYIVNNFEQIADTPGPAYRIFIPGSPKP